MKNAPRALLAVAVTLVLAGLGLADTLELKDGRVLQGKYLGGTQAVLRFEMNGEVQTFPTHDIVALTFTRNSGSAPATAPPPASLKTISASVRAGPGRAPDASSRAQAAADIDECAARTRRPYRELRTFVKSG